MAATLIRARARVRLGLARVSSSIKKAHAKIMTVLQVVLERNTYHIKPFRFHIYVTSG